MRTSMLVLVGLCACNPPIDEDTGLCPDTDGDGTNDCLDDDDDGDGLTDDDEAGLGTDPLDADSDDDGLSDGDEVNLSWTYSPDGGMTPASTSTDPLTPSLLVEVSYMVGHRPSATAVQRAVSSFDTAGVEALFLVDDGDAFTVVSPLAGYADLESTLSAHDQQDEYVHVLFADVDGTGLHGLTHFADPNDPAEGGHGNAPDPSLAGAVVYEGQIQADFTTHSTALGGVGVDSDDLVARTLVKQIGHLIGCTEEGPSGGYDTANAMIDNADLGTPGADPAAWQDATQGGGAGYPVLSEDSVAQIALDRKASVEIGTSPSNRAFDMGPASGPIGAKTIQVTETALWGPAAGWGWLEPLPTVASEEGSDAGDDRSADYVAGDPDSEAATQFLLTGLGDGPVGLFLRLGAVLDEARTVRCEVVHPELGTAFLTDTLASGGDSVQTPAEGVLVNPVEGQVLLTCLDDDTYDDAPIEYLRVYKHQP